MNTDGFQRGRITQSVMERIRREERWAYPDSGQRMWPAKKVRAWLAICFTAFFMLVVLTFFGLTDPAYLSFQQEDAGSSLLKEVIGAGEIGYANSGVSTLGHLALEQMVASIGEPKFANLKHSSAPESVRLILGFSALCIISLILMMNWIVQHAKRAHP